MIDLTVNQRYTDLGPDFDMTLPSPRLPREEIYLQYMADDHDLKKQEAWTLNTSTSRNTYVLNSAYQSWAARIVGAAGDAEWRADSALLHQ